MERLKAQFWQQAILFRLLLPFCMGIILARYHPIKHAELLCASVTIICIALLLLLRQATQPRSSALLTFLALCTIGIWTYSRSCQKPNSAMLIPCDSPCLCTVLKVYPSQNGYQKLELQILSLRNASVAETKALLFLQGADIHLFPGDSILVPYRWQRIQNSGIPGDFDIAAHYSRKQIYFREYCSVQQLRILGRAMHAQQGFLTKLSQSAAQVIDKSIEEPKASALLKAMLLGDERDIDPETRAAYADTGIVHIISISGAHVALLFGLIQTSLFWLTGKRKKTYQFLLSSLLIFLYVGMAGAPSSAVRAAAMFFFLQLGIILKHRSNPLNQLCAAAFLMLLFRPLWLFHIGFQLSFLAVTSLMIFYRPLICLWPAKKKAVLWVRNAIAASIAAEILVAPLVAFYFHSFPLLFLPANLIAAAGMTLIESIGLLLLLLHKIGWLEVLLAKALIATSNSFHKIIFLLQEVTIDALKRIYLSIPSLFVSYLTIACVYYFLKHKSLLSGRLSLLCLCTLTGLHVYRLHAKSAQAQLLLWWTNKQPNGLIIKAHQSRTICGYACNERSVHELLIRSGVQYPDSCSGKLFILAGEKVILVDRSLKPNTPISADVLLIQTPDRSTSPQLYLAMIRTKTIVVANYLSYENIRTWRYQCRKSGIRFHYLPKDGPFILQAQ